jgi:photosystem II stability/assembly factor-like uncharacterized protein
MHLIERTIAALAGAALLAAAHAAPAPRFADPLATPAMASPLAERGLVNALALAGTRVVAVGQRGHVLYSDNDGAAWKQARVPLSADLAAVYFASPGEGWAVGHDGVILHSTDGGASWERRFDGRNDPQVADKPLLDVWFDAQGRGLAVGAFGLVLRSEDRGRSWRHAEDLMDNPKGLHLNAIRALGQDLYIVGEQGLVLKRPAGAARFTAVATPYQGSFFGLAGDDQRLVVFGLRGTALYSADGGGSWSSIATGTRTGLVAGAVQADGALLLLSQGGQLLRSRDGGASFRQVEGVPAGPSAALLSLPGGGLLIGGPRGLRAQALTEVKDK